MSNYIPRVQIPITRIENGLVRPLAGASVYVYENASLTTPATVYTNSSQSIAKTQPVVTDSQGIFDCFMVPRVYYLKVVPLIGPEFILNEFEVVAARDLRVNHIRGVGGSGPTANQDDFLRLSSSRGTLYGILDCPQSDANHGLNIPVITGSPSGVALEEPGSICLDFSTGRLYIFDGSVWKYVTLT